MHINTYLCIILPPYKKITLLNTNFNDCCLSTLIYNSKSEKLNANTYNKLKISDGNNYPNNTISAVATSHTRQKDCSIYITYHIVSQHSILL